LAHSKGSFKRFKGEEIRGITGNNPPGLLVDISGEEEGISFTAIDVNLNVTGP
jgi:hypothetical protein